MEAILTKGGTILIDVGMKKAGEWIKRKVKKEPLAVDELKRRTRVLFVDDEDFSVSLTTIREAGWNVSQMKDITNFNCEEVKTANIIFMDYMGVGQILTPTEQGIGLIKTLKKRYPEKQVIFYSGHAGFIPGHEIHSIADGWINKHSDAYVYIDQIEASSRKIHD